MKQSQKWSKKRKIVVWSSLVAGVLLAGLTVGWWWLVHRDDGLSPEERLLRNLHRATDPESTMIEKIAALQRSWPDLSKMEEAKRRQILVRAALDITNQTLKDFAALPPEDKERRASLICEDAERTYELFRSFPPAKREAILNMVRSPEGKAEFNQVVGAIGSDLSAGDRRMLGPAVSTWQKMLENR